MSPLRTKRGELTHLMPGTWTRPFLPTSKGPSKGFPRGMKWLGDKLHSMDLHFGIYGSPSARDCAGYPGAFDHEYQDAETYAKWGVDLLRYDNCFVQFNLSDTYARQVFPNYDLDRCPDGTGQECVGAINWAYIQGYNFALAMEGLTQNPLNFSHATGGPADADNKQGMLDVRSHPFVPVSNYNADQQAGGIINRGEVYTLMGDAIDEATNKTGRPMIYSICPIVGGCRREDGSIVAEYYKEHAHMSMNQCIQFDNTDSWSSFLYHIDDAARTRVWEIAEPGYFNDMDALMIGKKGQSGMNQDWSEYRSQFSLFCILASPLIFSADMIQGTKFNGTLLPEMRQILMNPEMIAVDQVSSSNSSQQSFTCYDCIFLLSAIRTF